MEKIDLVNHNPVENTGRDALIDRNELAVRVAKLIVSGTFLENDTATNNTVSLLLKALVPLDELQTAFGASLVRTNEQAKLLEEHTKKATGKAKDAAQKLNDALLRLEKTVNIATMEKRVELLERAADAMERLSALQQTGKLDKILNAIK